MDDRLIVDDNHSSNLRSGHRVGVVVGVSFFLLLFLALSLSASLQKSPTTDETLHLVAGYSYLKWGDFRFNPEHPPLAKILAALPLLGLDVDNTPLNREQRDIVQSNRMYGWRLANRWLFVNNDAETIFKYAKLPMVALGVSLGILVFCWARELYGMGAGFVALGLYSLDPNIIGHTPIVHTDIPLALFLFAGTFVFWRMLKEVTWRNWLLGALFVALAIITKFSGIAVLFIWVILGIVRIFSKEPIKVHIGNVLLLCKRGEKTRWVATIVLSASLLSYLTIWAVYGFRYDAVAGQHGALEVGHLSQPSKSMQAIGRLNREYHVVPEAWWTGLHYAYANSERSAYLLGKISDYGFWVYFPVAFAVKTPFSTIMFLLLSLFGFLSRDKYRKDEEFLLIPIVVIFSFAVMSRMNIGLRHILSIYPFLFVWLGGRASNLWTRGLTGQKCILPILGLWLAISSIKTYPNYIAYFNEAIGAIAPHEILADSNLDWGQDLKDLKRWMDKNGIKNIQLAYFGTADPVFYGIEAVYKAGTWTTVMSGSAKKDELGMASYIAISATHLVGANLRPSNTYARFQEQEPIAIIGKSIFVYKLPIVASK